MVIRNLNLVQVGICQYWQKTPQRLVWAGYPFHKIQSWLWRKQNLWEGCLSLKIQILLTRRQNVWHVWQISFVVLFFFLIISRSLLVFTPCICFMCVCVLLGEKSFSLSFRFWHCFFPGCTYWLKPQEVYLVLLKGSI